MGLGLPRYVQISFAFPFVTPQWVLGEDSPDLTGHGFRSQCSSLVVHIRFTEQNDVDASGFDTIQGLHQSFFIGNGTHNDRANLLPFVGQVDT